MNKDQRARDRANREGLARQLRIAADPAMPIGRRKRASRYAAALAEKLGILVRPDRCSWCRRRLRLERHHPEHLKPLEVIFVCASCHREADRMTWSEASA